MSTIAPEPPVSRSMPALLEVPLPGVWLDGTELGPAVLRSLGPIRVRREVSSPAVCELELDLTGDLPRPSRGMALRVRIEGSADDLFDGELVRLSHRLGPDGIHRVRLRGFDKSHRLRQTSAVTAHTEVDAAKLATALAGRHGLGVDAQATGPEWPRLIQRGESDLDLLSRVVAEAGLWWELAGEDLTLRRWEVVEEQEATWGIDLYEAVVDSDGTAAAGTVRALGWDPVERKTFDVQAGTSAAGAAPGLGDLLGGSGDAVLADRVVATSAHAEGLAQRELDARTVGVDTVRAVVRGDLRWRPGVGLRLADQPDGLAGPYLLTAVEHVVDPFSGYVCLVSSAPLPRPAAPAGPAAAFTPARVVDVDDPDRAGRVKVTFPLLDGAESEWLPVITLGAGAGKGLFCQPDTDDTVLVLHTTEDPGRGLVLGGLYAEDLPSDGAGVSGGDVRRFGLTTADGQRLLLNRDGDQVLIGNAAESRLEMSEEAVLLHSAVDLTIAAPGRRLVIKADTIDFQRG